MQTFKIKIQETYSKIVEIEAETLSDALDIAHYMYNTEEIVLDASDQKEIRLVATTMLELETKGEYSGNSN